MSAPVFDRAGRKLDELWREVGDDEAIGAEACIISFARAVREGAALAARDGRLGVRIGPADAIEEIAALVPRLSLIIVVFPGFRDGRGYSTARLARERYHFTGQLRAEGDVGVDQLFFMMRCGFDAFALTTRAPEAALARAARRFSQVYQSAADGRERVAVLRHVDVEGAGE